MSRYLEPGDHGASNLPPSSPAAPRVERVRPYPLRQPRRDRSHHQNLHAFGYADSNDWRDPIPVPATETTPRSSSGVETWMVMMTKTLLLE